MEDIDDLREGVGLRGYAGRDPLVEYKAEAYKLFESLVAAIDYEVVHRIYKIQLAPQEQQTVGGQQSTSQTSTSTSTSVTATNQPPMVSRQSPVTKNKIGRNDPCPCGSGLKYKRCGLISAPQHKG